MNKKRALFLCNHNSSRSIMAEAMVNYFLADRWTAYSAGSNPTSVNPCAVRALRELGIEMPEARSKSIDYFRGQRFDRVFTLCDEAREACPVWLDATVVGHLGFPDPSTARGNDDDKLAVFRMVRDQIREKILPLLTESE